MGSSCLSLSRARVRVRVCVRALQARPAGEGERGARRAGASGFFPGGGLGAVAHGRAPPRASRARQSPPPPLCASSLARRPRSTAERLGGSWCWGGPVARGAARRGAARGAHALARTVRAPRRWTRARAPRAFFCARPPGRPRGCAPAARAARGGAPRGPAARRGAGQGCRHGAWGPSAQQWRGHEQQHGERRLSRWRLGARVRKRRPDGKPGDGRVFIGHGGGLRGA